MPPTSTRAPRPLPSRRAAAALAAVAALALGGCVGPGPACPCECAPAAPNRWMAAGAAHGRGTAAVWSYLASTYDRDGDGRVTAEEAAREPKAHARLDRDGDGVWTRADFEGPTMMAGYITAMTLGRIAAAAPGTPPAPTDELPTADAVKAVLAASDADGDGMLTAAEIETALAAAQARPVAGVLDLPAGVRPFPFLLEAADTDRSGRLTAAELLTWRDGVADREARAEAEARARAAAAPPAGAGAPTGAAPGRPRRPEAPAVGDVAPDFTLRSRGGTTTRTLSDLRGTPVVLVFGSYTCPPFRASAPWIRAAWDRHHDAARFLFVYVREAHAIDGRAPMPEPGQPAVEEPRGFEDRRAVADACALDLRFGVFETLVDDLDDAVARAYVAPPARLYVVGRDGRVVYRSGPGPFGLKQAEFDAGLAAALAAPHPAAPAAGPAPREPTP